MMKRKGTVLIETIVSAILVGAVLYVLLIVIASEKPIVHYASDRMFITSLAYTKMTAIEQDIRNNPNSFKVSSGTTKYYYGFKYAPGSDDDYKIDPEDKDHPEYSTYPGTFYKLGYPEYRYQFYIDHSDETSSETCLYTVHLIVWRRAKEKNRLILKEVLNEEVYSEDCNSK